MPNVDEDQILVERSQQGDNDAFDKLVQKYQDKIYRQCYLFTNDVGDALDLTQEAFIRVFQSLNNFKAQSSFYTWLFRIVHNICVDYTRHKKAYLDAENVYSEDISNTPFSESNEIKELEDEVSKAMDILPSQVKSTIILRYYEGLDYKSISDVLGCRISVIKSNLSKGMRMLRNALLPYLKGNSISLKESDFTCYK